MPLVSPVVFPLLPIVDGKCACGNEDCGRAGQHPAVAWGDLEIGSAVPRPAEGAGYGIKTGASPKGSGVVVVDLDSETALEAFEALGGAPETYTVATSRGFHLYFEHPGFPVRNAVSELAPKIDIRGDGGFVVGPGSPHRSGAVYKVIDDSPPAPLPDWLRAWLEARRLPETAAIQSYPGDVTDPDELEYRKGLYRKYLETQPPCIQDSGGDKQLFTVVQRGAYDLALPTDEVLAILREDYDGRCVPPWGDELESRVRHKARSAKTNSTRPRKEPPPRGLADWFSDLPAPSNNSKRSETTQERGDLPLGSELPNREQDDGILWGVWDEPIDPPTWLVDGLIPVGTVGGFVAHGSSLKTWTLLSVGTAVAEGVPWLNKYMTRKGRVLVVDYESGDYELRRRMKVLDGGKIPNLGAWPIPPLRIDDEAFWKKLASIPDLALVCIDSLAAGATGVDENVADAARPMQYAKKFADATGCAVLFIHHSKKDDGGDARKAVRGSTAIYAAMDWCYAFENVEETTTYRRMNMFSIKSRTGAKPHPVPLELTTEEGLTTYATERKPKKDAPEDEIQGAIELALMGRPMGIETLAKVAKFIGVRKEKVGPELDALVVRRRVCKVPGLGYVLNTTEALKARVSALVEGEKGRLWQSEAKIAKAAGVDTQAILDLVTEGFLCRQGGGGFLVPKRELVPEPGTGNPPDQPRQNGASSS